MILTHAAGLLIFSAVVTPDTARMDQVVESYAAEKKFMGSVLVARGSNTVFSKGYGSANLEWNIPNSPTTKFRLGSITKQFTAASILLLEERGKLSVTDPIKKYLPDAPGAWDKITIYHVLTHTSGLPNFTDFPDYAATESFSSTPEKLVARFRAKPLDFNPGAKFSYSNSGYVLLGLLIEKVSGQTYEKFVQQNIFDALGMKDSGYDSNSAIITHRASGYSPGPHGPVNAGYVHMTIPFSAGALYSTTEDLLRWEEGLFGGKLLSVSSLEKMTTPFKDGYAFGLTVSAAGGHRVIAHDGGIEGFNTTLAYYPEEKITVAALANLNGPAVDAIAVKLAALALGEQVQLPGERKEITVSPEILSRYVGTYEMAPNVNMYISLEKGQLQSQLTGQGKVPLFAKSETRFFPKVVDAEIEFTVNPGNQSAALVLYQGGREIKAERKSVTVTLPPERKSVEIAPALLALYPGTYKLRPNFDLVITLENGQLSAQATGQPRFPLFAESETKFFLKVVDAQVEFFKGPDGAVTHLMLHQGGADIRGERQ